MEGSLTKAWEAVGFDVFLTRDRVPVLNAQPFLDPSLCRTLGDRPIDEVWLLQTSFDELFAGYRCGGVDDARYPDARVVEDTLVPLDELIAALEAIDPDDRPEVHLTAGFFPNVSHDPQIYAAEVLGRWQLADLEVPPVIVADLPLTLDAFRTDAGQRDLDVRTTLVWPRLPVTGMRGLSAAGHALGIGQGVLDPVQAFEDSGADGMRLLPTVATRSDARRVAAVADYLEIGPVDRPAEIRAFAAWPVDAILTSDPSQ